MVDLTRFREKNGLLQKDIADYLGVSRVFISLVESGKTPLPYDKYQRLLDNENGWDVSYLNAPDKQGDIIEQNGGRGNIGKIDGDCSELLALRKEVEMLRALVDELRSEKAEYWEMIKTLSGK